jgi:hypothetical protein
MEEARANFDEQVRELMRGGIRGDYQWLPTLHGLRLTFSPQDAADRAKESTFRRLVRELRRRSDARIESEGLPYELYVTFFSPELESARTARCAIALWSWIALLLLLGGVVVLAASRKNNPLY